MSVEGTASSRITLQPCTDIALLTRLYMELMEDEGHDVIRTEEEVYAGMEEVLRDGEAAYAFMAEGRVVGYALMIMKRTPPYLHHFYICRDARRNGYGTEAFHALLRTLQTDRIDLDVYVWNERGRGFWNSLGFKPRATIMRYESAR